MKAVLSILKPKSPFNTSLIRFNFSKPPHQIRKGMIDKNHLSKQITNKSLFNNNAFKFSSQNKLAPENIPKQSIQIRPSEEKVGEEQVKVYQTKGSISILDKVPGVKDNENGELYVLSFKCSKCQTTSIRSFTKHAYHKGVVLVRCGGCQNIHLVADNLGWFEDNPVNVETMHQGKVTKVRDQVAIVNFLKKAFESDKKQENIEESTNKKQ